MFEAMLKILFGHCATDAEREEALETIRRAIIADRHAEEMERRKKYNGGKLFRYSEGART